MRSPRRSPTGCVRWIPRSSRPCAFWPGRSGTDPTSLVDVITTCVAHLPAALLFTEIRAGQERPHTRAQLAAAVGAVLNRPGFLST